MTVLVWDQVGERRYETGIDRGVLYFPAPGVGAVPWNGLVAVSEDPSHDVKSFYIDGIKYLERHIPGSYRAKLSAFTYPDELDEFLGVADYEGLSLHDQRPKLFHLSYRTKVGNDLEGEDYGYKIHVVYNVMANPSAFTYDSLTAQMTAKPFEWDLSGTPETAFGIRPTTHVSIDSRKVASDFMSQLEDLFYGTVDVDPNLPSLQDLLDMAAPIDS